MDIQLFRTRFRNFYSQFSFITSLTVWWGFFHQNSFCNLLSDSDINNSANLLPVASLETMLQQLVL